MMEIKVKSSIDGLEEVSLLYKADGSSPRPLIVGLHTWSMDRFNQVNNLLPIAKELNWYLLLPEFRGPNLVTNLRGKEACGSKLAKQDIIDAVNYAIKSYPIDSNRVYLIGGSGGGHMSLLMAAYTPKVWKAVVAFVPITNLEKWYFQNQHYSNHIAYCCGGPPEGDTLQEYKERSPITFYKEIAKSNVKIFHGKWDTSVPFTHSLELYNKIVEEFPDSRTLLEIFDGGHEILVHKCMTWFLGDKSNNVIPLTR